MQPYQSPQSPSQHMGVHTTYPLTMLRWLLLMLAFAAVPVRAASTQTGFLDRTLTIEGVEYRYQVFVPRDFDPAKKWPVILALHGGGEYGADGLRQTAYALPNSIRVHPSRFPAIVVLPQAKEDDKPGWQGQGGRAALAQVDAAIGEFSGDASRVYLTGHSAGGNGAWYLASHYPDRFAALVPVCGFVSEFKGHASEVDYPAVAFPGEPDPFASVARRVAHIPVWIFHGGRDDVVPPEESRKMAAELKKLGAEVTYTELPEANHNAWDPAYDRADLFDWMFMQQRRK